MCSLCVNIMCEYMCMTILKIFEFILPKGSRSTRKPSPTSCVVPAVSLYLSVSYADSDGPTNYLVGISWDTNLKGN